MALLEGAPMSPEWLASVRARMKHEFGGAHFINLDVRRNGKNEHFQGDWVKTVLTHLLDAAAGPSPEVQGESFDGAFVRVDAAIAGIRKMLAEAR